MAKAVKEFGYRIGGLQAYVTTDVISSAGVSSSASFEMLFCSMVNFFFNSENRMSPITYAKIGQFAENRYWGKASGLMHAIDTQDTRQILQLITKSGDSSWKLLQNCYAVSDYSEQKVALALALTELFLKRIGDGCCRVHGGGFAGVIMSVIPMQFADAYTQYISAYVGADAVYPMHIRQIGAIHLEK